VLKVLPHIVANLSWVNVAATWRTTNKLEVKKGKEKCSWFARHYLGILLGKKESAQKYLRTCGSVNAVTRQ